ncbi:MAG: carbohydrate ABC transporter permease [Butyrivibrio sp.]|nr:carbohydrate ABC transporter permease [Butyrivibrio sp.]
MKISRFANFIYTLLFILISIIMVIPVLFVVIISLSSERSIALNGYAFIPAEFSLSAYSYLWQASSFIGRAFINSIFITVAGTILGLFIVIPYGYALSLREFRHRNFFTVFAIIPMLFSGGLVASYMINTQIYHLANTYLSLLLPIACSSFYIFISRTWFSTSLPHELIDAGRIDGATELQIFSGLVLPLAKPLIATIGLFFTFGYWNSWYEALLYIDSNHTDLYTLQYMLISIERQVSSLAKNEQYLGVDSLTSLPTDSVRMAIVVVIVIPITMAFPFFQKYLISGLTMGALKD